MSEARKDEAVALAERIRSGDWDVETLEQALDAARQDEREACEQIALANANRWLNEPLRSDARADACMTVAGLIRARGAK